MSEQASDSLLRNESDALDFVWGCSFFGVGGGGTHEKGTAVLLEQLQCGRSVGWTDVRALADDALTVCAFGMGSIAPVGAHYQSAMEQAGIEPRLNVNYLIPAVQALQRYTGRAISAIIASELGGSNTPGAVAAGAALGLSVIDGDYSGRAVPELSQHTATLGGLDICPIASVDSWGDVCFIERTVNPAMAERIGKMLGVAAFGATGLAAFLHPVGQIKNLILRGTLTESLRVGRALRGAAARGLDPGPVVASATGGEVLFRGQVRQYDAAIEDGYFIGSYEIDGAAAWVGQTFRIWFKNENHITWLNGQHYVTSPDIIAVIDASTGRPMVNNAIGPGSEVTVIGVPARPAFRQESAIVAIGPLHFGFPFSYTPLEALLRAGTTPP